MTEFNTELPDETEMNGTTDEAMEGADVKPTTAPKPPRTKKAPKETQNSNTKKAPKETETGETPIVLANLITTKTSNTKEPETVSLGNGITAINR